MSREEYEKERERESEELFNIGFNSRCPNCDRHSIGLCKKCLDPQGKIE